MLAFAPLVAKGQTEVAEEVIRVEASSATVRTWFGLIEREGRLVLSYNPSLIDMDERVAITVPGRMRVGQLLAILLRGYDYRLIPMPGRKILIQVHSSRPPTVSPVQKKPVRQSEAEQETVYDLAGTVSEDGSGERLLGATITVSDRKGEHHYAVTDHNGFFNVNVPAGECQLRVSYIGYAPSEQVLAVTADRMLEVSLTPIPFQIKAVSVQRRKSREELDEVAPSNMIAFSNADLFSQIHILPGVAASSANMDINVAGGSADENLFLLDGFPVYNPGHINSMLSLFNGDALKSVSFYNGFIPTQFEGRLSSVTDVRLRDGNKQQFVNTLSLDMPSASAVFEGPVLRNRLSYLVGGRCSWLDFFDSFTSEDNRLNHSFHDFNAKLSYNLDSVTSVSLSAYNSADDYHMPDDDRSQSMLHWNNQLYALHFSTLISPKVSNATSLAYSIHATRANPYDYGYDSVSTLRSSIRSLFVNTEFTYSPGQLYTMRWGMKGTLEKYELAAFGLNLQNTWEPIKQLSLFYDNRIRVAHWLFAQVGVNYVRYIPTHSPICNSIQPRLSLKAAWGNSDLFHLSLSRMEQFFHHVRLTDLVTPFDFTMPSIEGFKPSTATHLELGWKHFTRNGVLELSAYYKYRTNVLALRPDVYVEDSQWAKYIMAGNGDSRGVSLYYRDRWWHLSWQLSYTLSKSREWFPELTSVGKLPSLYDFPHVLNGALSLDIGRTSLLTLGGNLHSGKVLFDSVDYEEEADPLLSFRNHREPLRYRIDASYTFHKEFRRSRLLLRVGLYNILGNPSEDELFYYFSVKIKDHCVPFGTVSFKF
ncbi:MAG: TonB-dependent receptor [Prevotella sp.]|nr:TonB-dependent receptor [Prevotella sp.]